MSEGLWWLVAIWTAPVVAWLLWRAAGRVRSVTAAKALVLRDWQGAECVLIIENGRIFQEYSALIVDVGPQSVQIRSGDATRSIPLGMVMGLRGPEGNVVANWVRSERGEPSEFEFPTFGQRIRLRDQPPRVLALSFAVLSLVIVLVSFVDIPSGLIVGGLIFASLVFARRRRRDP